MFLALIEDQWDVFVDDVGTGGNALIDTVQALEAAKDAGNVWTETVAISRRLGAKQVHFHSFSGKALSPIWGRSSLATEPLVAAAELLSSGGIVGVKGLGGFHLAKI